MIFLELPLSILSEILSAILCRFPLGSFFWVYFTYFSRDAFWDFLPGGFLRDFSSKFSPRDTINDSSRNFFGNLLEIPPRIISGIPLQFPGNPNMFKEFRQRSLMDSYRDSFRDSHQDLFWISFGESSRESFRRSSKGYS